MTNDLELINRLQEEIDIKLERVPLEEIATRPMTAFAADPKGQVKGLSIWSVELKRVPAVLSQFQQLERLVLDKTQISDISSLKESTGLTILFLPRNQISNICSLSRLRGLKNLDLSLNQISDIPSLKEMKSLKKLDFRYNKISRLLAEILDLGLDIKWEYEYKKEGIFLEGNPLAVPPMEVILQGNASIRHYFQSLAGGK